MKRVTLHSLKCLDTETWFGPDEPELRFNVDGRTWKKGWKKVGNGHTVSVDGVLEGTDITVDLWELDTDPDDWLGGLDFTDVKPGKDKTTFRRSGAKYELTYTVVEQPRFLVAERFEAENCGPGFQDRVELVSLTVDKPTYATSIKCLSMRDPRPHPSSDDKDGTFTFAQFGSMRLYPHPDKKWRHLRIVYREQGERRRVEKKYKVITPVAINLYAEAGFDPATLELYYEA